MGAWSGGAMAPPSPASLGIPAVRRSSGEDAALYIRRLIFDGELRPGSRVPQDDIAQALGISRIPIREALIALERDGWVTIEPHRGAFVDALDAQTVRDHYELYGIVYGFAVRRALARSGEDLVVHLRPLVDHLAAAREPADVTRAAFAFHRLIVEGARSPRVKVVIRAMAGLVPGDFFTLVPDAIDVERRGLPAILSALEKGDEERAADEYMKMMRRVGKSVVEVLGERGLFEPAALPATRRRPPR
ncbi:MAG TPA: GntR family transcriptional regulator [Acidimicrobiales bacterium]